MTSMCFSGSPLEPGYLGAALVPSWETTNKNNDITMMVNGYHDDNHVGHLVWGVDGQVVKQGNEWLIIHIAQSGNCTPYEIEGKVHTSLAMFCNLNSAI